MTFDTLINKYFHLLNDNDLHILSFIKNNLQLCSKLSISELSAHCNISTASIIRTSQKLGFSGYSEFKFFLKQVLQKERATIPFSIQTLEKDIQQTIQMFRDNPIKEELYHAMDQANIMYAFGMGRGHRLMIEEFSRCLLNIPKNLLIISGFAEFNLASKSFHKDNLVFIVSQTGILSATEYESLPETIHMLNLNKIPTVSITQASSNELSTYADYNFYFQNSNFNDKTKMNDSSFVTLLVLLHLIYEGYYEFINT